MLIMKIFVSCSLKELFVRINALKQRDIHSVFAAQAHRGLLEDTCTLQPKMYDS